MPADHHPGGRIVGEVGGGKGGSTVKGAAPLAGGFVEEHFEPLDTNDLLTSSL